MSEGQDNSPFIWVNEFTEESVKGFYESFLSLESDRTMPMITIYIDSYGGDVCGLMAMRDLVKSTEKPVATVCIGKAMSAGACLLASGTEGLRFMSKHAEVMIHESHGGVFGKNSEIQSGSKRSDRINQRMLKNLADDMGVPFGDIDKKLQSCKNADWFLSAPEAKKWGVIDNIEIPRIMYQDSATVLVRLPKKKGK